MEDTILHMSTSPSNSSQGATKQPLRHLLRLQGKASGAEIHQKVLEGLSYKALVSFQKQTGLAQGDLFDIIDLSSATATRRRKDGRLSARESDRLARVARIVGQASELFDGNLERTVAWLQREQRALGGERPWSFLATDAGAQEVEDLIDRLLDGSLA
jgi:putative toxin-antitoxin system antitoxin component (TIGR02293 family)